MEPTTTPKKPTAHKLFPILGVLVLCLVASLFVRLLIKDRIRYSNQANETIQKRWGDEVVAFSPVLRVTTTTPTSDTSDTDRTDSENPFTDGPAKLIIHPTLVDTTIHLEPEQRSYGIFRTIVYTTQITVTGTFAVTPELRTLLARNYGIDFIAASSVFSHQQLGASTLTLNTESIDDTSFSKEILPMSVDFNWLTDTIHLHGVAIPSSVGLAQQDTISFTYTTTLKGSDAFAFHAPRTDATISIAAPWKTVSLGGILLPEHRTLAKKSFDAQWVSSGFADDQIQSYRDYSNELYTLTTQEAEIPTVRESDSTALEESLSSSLYTAQVKLLEASEQYTKTDRATKYALLFITLTFLVLFLFEILKNVRIHPMQYFLIGAGLAMFYLLLLALSEHIGFLLAYVIASLSIIAISTWYVRAFLTKKKQVFIVTGLLGFLYVFMYLLLQLRDYTLLAGTLFIFVVLFITMYTTRGIDWYSALGKGDTK